MRAKRSGPHAQGAAPYELVACQATTAIQSIASGADGFTTGGYDITALPDSLARRIIVDPQSNCWIWQGHLDKDGYGRTNGRGTHRLVYLLLAGPIPAGLICDHREDWGCTSRACCNPAHINITTVRENTLRGRGPSAVNARKTACDHGHEFTPANTYRSRDGKRGCRACGVGRTRRYRERLRDLRLHDDGDQRRDLGVAA